MKTVFKKGMKVYWGRLEGVVEDVDFSENCPVSVMFDTICESFTKDGRLYDGLPKVLSTTPYELKGFSQEEPLPEIEVDTLVYVSNDNERWEMAYFKCPFGSHQLTTWADQKKSSDFLDDMDANSTNNWKVWKHWSIENPLLKK